MAERPLRKSHPAPKTVPQHKIFFACQPGQVTPPIYYDFSVRTPSISSGRHVSTSPDVFGRVNGAYRLCGGLRREPERTANRQCLDAGTRGNRWQTPTRHIVAELDNQKYSYS